ncbi:hypothetical protein EV385_6190 [Krasilnikovia cinnamomea]|uniref:Uncharacterized protein n=1 Tax=Krasilnikovia cinnamomea TaxID=349313 RepID=A0A4Q7ZSR0_9ACTN|nr:hypothetical protein [Krasilnikovia cinnamomea]RZU54242.1 hypothetical protein EV385_6190 [Krasilnikovia cinnamomea]
MRVRIASTLAVVAATIGLAATAAGPVIAAFDSKPSSSSTETVEAGRGRIMRDTPPSATPSPAATTPAPAATTQPAKGKNGK